MKAGIGFIICLALFAPALAAKAKNTSPDFQPPRVVRTVEPSYPVNTVSGGTVILKVTVSSSGEVKDVQVLQEAKGFTRQAIEAVRKWKFEAAKLNGRAVPASVPVAFSFSQPIVWWNHQGK